MKLLALPAPPEFVETLGYSGNARYVAFWWTPYGDELCFADGTTLVAGASWPAWLAFVQHPLTRACLAVAAGEAGVASFDFGSSESEAADALLVDRWEGTLHVLSVGEAEAFLHTQPNEIVAAKEAYDLSDEDVIARLSAAYEERSRRPSRELLAQAQAHMERDRRLQAQMVRWLDELQRRTEDAAAS